MAHCTGLHPLSASLDEHPNDLVLLPGGDDGVGRRQVVEEEGRVAEHEKPQVRLGLGVTQVRLSLDGTQVRLGLDSTQVRLGPDDAQAGLGLGCVLRWRGTG